MRKLVEEKVIGLFRAGYEEGIEDFIVPFPLTNSEMRELMSGHIDNDVADRFAAHVRVADDAELLVILDTMLCQKYR